MEKDLGSRQFCYGNTFTLADIACGMALGYETPSIFAVICDNYIVGTENAGVCLHRTPKQIFEV
jgi:glutathione S-transferase